MIDEKKLIEDLIYCRGLGRMSCDDVLKTIKEQPKVGEWIPCSERLPSESNYYMACIYNQDIDDFDFRKTWFAHVDDYDIEESEWRELYGFETVTAWKSLPEPYKSESPEQPKPPWADAVLRTFLGRDT